MVVGAATKAESIGMTSHPGASKFIAEGCFVLPENNAEGPKNANEQSPDEYLGSIPRGPAECESTTAMHQRFPC